MKGKILLALTAGIVMGICIVVSMQSFMAALDLSISRKNLADCMSISQALERYREDTGQYPPLDNDPDHLSAHLVPTYIAALPRDTYGQPYLVFMGVSGAAVVSTGLHGGAAERGIVVRKTTGDNQE